MPVIKHNDIKDRKLETTPFVSEGRPGVEITKVPFVNFSVRETFDLAKTHIKILKSHPHLTDFTAAASVKYNRDIPQITSILINLKVWENNGTEKIGLITPHLWYDNMITIMAQWNTQYKSITAIYTLTPPHQHNLDLAQVEVAALTKTTAVYDHAALLCQKTVSFHASRSQRITTRHGQP